MKIDKWCDFNDCPNHPDYTEIEKEEEKISDIEFKKNMVPITIDKNDHNHVLYGSSAVNVGYANTYAANPGWSAGNTAIIPASIDWGNDIRLAPAETGIKLETESIAIPLECFACSFMEKVNMKKTLVVNKAKKLLQE